MKKLLCAIFALALVGVAGLEHNVSAQIEVPGIFKRKKKETPPAVATTPAETPTTTPVTQSNVRPSSGVATSAAAPVHVMDDGYTFFHLANVADTANGKPVSKGWYLESKLRYLAALPAHSAFKLTISKGGQAVATVRCEGETDNGGGDYAVTQVNFSNDNCYQRDKLVQGAGRFQIQVAVVNGDTDAETLVRTYEIDVHKVDRIRGSISAPTPDAPEYFVSRHGELLSSVVNVYNTETEGHYLQDTPGTNRRYGVSVSFGISTKGNSFPQGYVKCSVDGQKLAIPGHVVANPKNLPHRYYEYTYSDRLVAPYKNGGNEYRDTIEFRQFEMFLPITHANSGGGDEDLPSLDKYPGNWTCSWMANGETLRTWRWRVANGAIVPHPEQGKSINLIKNAYLVETEIPADSSVDARIVPAEILAGFMYGQKWQTAEGKAMAAKVTAKGNPYPVPSTQAAK